MYLYTQCGMRNCFWICEIGLSSVNNAFGKTIQQYVMHSYDYYFSFNYFGHCIKILQKISWKLSVWPFYPPLRLVLESLALCTFLSLLHWVMDLYFLVTVTFCPWEKFSSKPLWGDQLDETIMRHLPVCVFWCMHKGFKKNLQMHSTSCLSRKPQSDCIQFFI